MSEPRPSVAAVSRPASAPERPKRKRRRWPWVLVLVLLVVLALAAVAFVIVDQTLRARSETQIEQQVQTSLPAGVTGRVTASIAGRWVIPQLLKGEFDHVTLVSKGLQIEDAPAAARIQLYGVPVQGGTIGEATGDLTVGQAVLKGLPAVKKVHGSDPVLGAGTVSTTITQTFLSLPVKVKVVLKPQLADQTVLLTPVDATITAGPASVPATAIVQQLLPKGLTVCAASYLPKGLKVDYLKTRRGSVSVGLSAFQLDIDHLDTAKRGSCA